jgi:hypothetical protein
MSTSYNFNECCGPRPGEGVSRRGVVGGRTGIGVVKKRVKMRGIKRWIGVKKRL